MSTEKSYDVKIVVASCWFGNVQADTAPEAENAASAAFDTGKLEQCMEQVIHVDVRPSLKTFKVLYAVEQGFTVNIEAASAEDAEASVKKQLHEDRAPLSSSELGHFENTIIEAKEVTP